MTMDSQYLWTHFYMELADKLLTYKYDRQALIARLQRVSADVGISLLRAPINGLQGDIDPFTVFALFNQGQKEVKRKRILKGLARCFQLSTPVPDDFRGVPSLRSGYSAFVHFRRKLESVNYRRIELLWQLFEAAVMYADEPTDSSRSALLSSLGKVQCGPGVNWKITVGLYWVRPFVYLSLHSCERWVLLETNLFNARRLVEVNGTLLQPDQYLDLCDRALLELGTGVHEFKSIPDFSRYALRIYEEANIHNVVLNSGKAAFGVALGDDGVQTVRYWLYAPGRGACMWEEFYERGVMGLGWHQLGDLRGYATKEEMRQRLLETRDDNTSQTNSARAVWQFANEMKPGDVIFVKRGLKEIIGRGVVTGDYVYDPDGGEYPHLRDVSWNRQGSWRSDQQFAMKTLTEITDYPDLLAHIEAYFENDEDSLDSEQMPVPLTEYSAAQFLKEVYMGEERYDAIAGLLRTKKNIIMQGAPGVGKTYAAKRLAYSMMGVKDASRVMLVQFHQSYSYEDFIEGYRPSGAGFELVKGAFYSFCKKAADDEENDYFFIIDEINRGNLSKIFGELFMLIESDKRGDKLQLLYSRELFYVPKNVHIIGMMNTADRSLAMLDYALRRRFAFVELRPAFDSNGFRDYCAGLDNSRFEALVREVESLNRAIADDESLGEGFCIGHSYFCNMEADSCTDAALASIVDYELIPMLKEYWFDEPSKVREWSDRLHRSLR